MPLIKDARSPRGRFEEWPKRWSVLDIKPPSTGTVPDKATGWRDSRNWLSRGRGGSSHRERPNVFARSTATCVECGCPFQAAILARALYCGATCRMRANRAARLARKAA